MTQRTFRFEFDRSTAIRFAIYARMSSDMQNPDSPQRQIETIRETLVREGLGWLEVAVYVDSAISGKFTTRRPQLMKLLSDIQSKRIQVAAVIVDTPERMGRNEDVHAIRRSLMHEQVVLLDALSKFRDPTTREGRILSFFADMHGEVENEIKSHIVSNAKKAAVRKKLWPGGRPPTGYMLEICGTEKRKGKDVLLKRLAPNPALSTFPTRCFEVAAETGWGSPRIAKALNADPTIPEELKPIHANTVDRILENKIYVGIYEWGKETVHVINDIRVVEKNDPNDWLIVSDYCPPLVSQELFDRVQALKEQRRTAHEQPSSEADQSARVGRALKYPLSGHVRCECCGNAMVASKRKRYRDASYRCNYVAPGICTNRSVVPETWLRGEVMRLLNARLFGLDEACSEEDLTKVLLRNPTFQEFCGLVQDELQRLESEQPSTTQALRSEQSDLKNQQDALILSLRMPTLNNDLRNRLDQDYSKMESRINEIEIILTRLENVRATVESTCRPEHVARQLCEIACKLNGRNAASANLEFARVLDRITVDCHGVVRIRMCKYAFLLPSDLQPSSNRECDVPGSRRLPGRAIPTDIQSELRGQLRGDNSFAMSRFGGYGPEWFWEDELNIPEKKPWAEEHGLEVAELRLQNPCTIDALSDRFGVVNKMIYAALAYAKEHGVDATNIDGRTFQGNWAKENAAAVVAFLKANGNSMRLAEQHFKKSASTIRKAIRFANESAGDNQQE